MARQLASQQRLAQEATRELAQVSTDNYMDLLDSVFSFYQGGTSSTQRRAEEAQRRVEEAEARAEEARGRAEEAQSARSEAESQTEEAKRSAREARRRAKGAEESAGAAQRRAEEAERRAEEANRRAEEAERRAEAAESGRSEAEGRGGDEEGDTNAADAASQPQSKRVWTPGRSGVRGRNIGSPGGTTFGRGGRSVEGRFNSPLATRRAQRAPGSSSGFREIIFSPLQRDAERDVARPALSGLLGEALTY